MNILRDKAAKGCITDPWDEKEFLCAYNDAAVFMNNVPMNKYGKVKWSDMDSQATPFQLHRVYRGLSLDGFDPMDFNLRDYKDYNVRTIHLIILCTTSTLCSFRLN